MSFTPMQVLRLTHEEPAHRVPRVEAEPSEYAMKEGPCGAVA